MKIDLLLMKLAEPARRAIQQLGITTLEQLARFSEKEISGLHGIGKNALSIMKTYLNINGLAFYKKEEGRGDPMSVKDLVRNNRTFRRFYQQTPIKRTDLEELVDLARLSASAANLQPLKYILTHDPEKNDLIFPHLKWAGYLTEWKGPEEGERPSAYIIMLGDKEISKNILWDHGIACQSILLGACEKGLGGCIIASVDKDAVRKNLNIPEQYDILLVIALGKPKEQVVIDEIDGHGSVKYWRDENAVHHVPKRKLKDIIIDL